MSKRKRPIKIRRKIGGDLARKPIQDRKKPQFSSRLRSKETVVDKKRTQLSSRLRSVESELYNTLSSFSHIKSDINYIEGAIASVPSRLQKVRSEGYEVMSYLEKNQEILTSKWNDTGSQIREDYLYNIEPLKEEARRIQSQISSVKSGINRKDFGWAQSELSALSSEVSSLRNSASSEINRASKSLKDFKSGFNALDSDIGFAEKTMQLASQASFPWKEGESPILALNAKLMTGEKPEGTFFLTNQRILFEGMKEEVLERKFFIATKKKTVRTLLLNQPIGVVKEIEEGTVSFWAGAGIYIRFKPESGLEEIPLDVKSGEVDLIKKWYNFIDSGEAEQDIKDLRGEEGKPTKKKPKVLSCPNCGAPYTQEIYRGQTSVQCDYCGSVIPVET
jgi:archaellum component FlaC/DNA-directed RNA polymerase subunit RPC12/RpoP